VPPEGLVLRGALRAESRRELYNSLFAIGKGGEVVAAYDKRHLVPFGEYVPFRRFFPFLSAVAAGDDFAVGQGAAVLTVGGLPPFRPLICYEGIFAHEIASAGQPRAQWLLNITNDAWFGISPGPYQHFEMARLRAVEQGVPLIRVANTGLSGVVDAMGRVTHLIPLGQEGVEDVLLPQPLPTAPLYGRAPAWPVQLWIGVIASMMGYRLIKSRKKQKSLEALR
jgi:apolipoprotein N-acyltransferase